MKQTIKGMAAAALLAISGLSTAQTVEYIHTDALGTPIAVTDTAGAVIERSEYEPFGAVLSRPVKDGPGFTGHVEDGATGLTYMQQRYYDPSIGRFLSVDPIAPDPNRDVGFNRYAYVENNPLRFVDPDGRAKKDKRSLNAHSSNRGAVGSVGNIPEPWRQAGGAGAATVAAAPQTAAPGAGAGAGALESIGAFMRGLLGRAVVTAPLVIGGDSRDDGQIHIYRVVGAAEYASIHATGRWGLPPNGYGVKQFWPTVADAQRFAAIEKAANLPGANDYRFIMSSTISRQTSAMGPVHYMDGAWALNFDSTGLFHVNRDAAATGGIKLVRTISP